jgi:AcrR family transcriptional regulator
MLRKERMSQNADKRPDRRIQRTQQLLFQAFREIAREKDFAAISVRDITERANVNRGTFYAHFADKYALLEAFARHEFRQQIAAQLTEPLQCSPASDLKPFIVLVLDYLKAQQRQCRPAEQLVPLFQQAIHDELAAMLARWLQLSAPDSAEWRVPPERIATMMSWAICGAAAQQFRSAAPLPLEQLAHEVQLVLREGVAHLIPQTPVV